MFLKIDRYIFGILSSHLDRLYDNFPIDIWKRIFILSIYLDYCSSWYPVFQSANQFI